MSPRPAPVPTRREVVAATDRLVTATLAAPGGTELLAAWGLGPWAVRVGAAAPDPEVAVAQMDALRTLWSLRRDLDGPVLVLKGPALAARWPDGALRPTGDLDVVVPDADDAWRRLRAGGWTPVPGRDGEVDLVHHRRHWHAWPLEPPGGGTAVELHRRVPGAPWLLRPPSIAGLLERSSPATALGVDGVHVPAPADHAVAVAAASWGHHPYERVGQLVDVALLAADAERVDPGSLARAVDAAGARRLWCAVWGAARALLFGDPPPVAWRLLGDGARAGAVPTALRARRGAGLVLAGSPPEVARHVVRSVRAAALGSGRGGARPVTTSAGEAERYGKRNLAAGSALDNPYRRVLELVTSPVLDVGCGSGDVGAMLVEAGHAVDGVELDAERRAVAAPRLGTVHADVDAVTDRYATVLLLDVIEHVADPVALVRAAASRLEAGGQLVVKIPNSANVRVRWRVARGDWSYTDDGFFDRGHLRFFDLRTIDAVAHDAGLRVAGVWHYGRFPGWVRGRQALLRARPNLLAESVVAVWRPRA